MRILIENVNGDPFRHCGGEDTSGQNLYVRELACRLADRGHKVDIATRATQPDDAVITAVSHNVRVFRVPGGPAEYLFRDDVLGFLDDYARNLTTLIRDERTHYDIVHGNYWLSIPVVCDIQIAGLADRLVYTPHSLGRKKSRSVGIAISQRDSWEQAICEHADGIHVLSGDEESWLRELYTVGGIVRRISHGVNPDFFRYIPQDVARRRVAWHDTATILLFVGRFEPQKNLPAVLRTFGKIRRNNDIAQPVEMHIVGGPKHTTVSPDDLPEPIRDSLAELGSEPGVVFHGRVANDQLAWMYAAADVMLMPSHYEPFGLTAAECLACGTPVAAFATGGLRETIVDGVNGLLSPVRDEHSLHECARRLLNPPWNTSQARRDVASSNSQLTWEQSALKHEQFYTDIMSSRSRIQ